MIALLGIIFFVGMGVFLTEMEQKHDEIERLRYENNNLRNQSR